MFNVYTKPSSVILYRIWCYIKLIMLYYVNTDIWSKNMANKEFSGLYQYFSMWVRSSQSISCIGEYNILFNLGFYQELLAFIVYIVCHVFALACIFIHYNISNDTIYNLLITRDSTKETVQGWFTLFYAAWPFPTITSMCRVSIQF